MKIEEIVETIQQYINQFVGEERIEKIKELQRSLTYELRWAELTDEEREYVRGIPHMTDEIRERLNSMDMDKKQQKEYLSGLAKYDYITQLAWDSYFFGFSEEKPFIPISPKKVSLVGKNI